MLLIQSRRGITLIELTVALTVIGISSGVVLLAWGYTAPTDARALPDAVSEIIDARRQAIASGRPQRLRLRLAGDGALLSPDDVRAGSIVRFATIYADGSVVADSSLGIDRLAGRAVVDHAPVR